jgi:uncharacterized protein (TIGR02594 family)
MADDRLELVASVKNLTRGPIADIARSMRALAADTKIGHQQGATFAKEHALALTNLRRQVVESGTAVRCVLAPALGTLGIASLSAAGGIAAIVASIKGFSESARHLTFLSRQTQLSVNQLRVLEELAGRIGSSAEAMDSGLATFGTHMQRLGRSAQGFRIELRELNEAALGLKINPRTSGIDELAQSLQGLDRDKQLEKVLNFALKFKDIDVRQKMLQIFGLPRELANVADAEELQKQLDRIKKIFTPTTAGELAGGRAFANAMDDIAASLKNIRDSLGGELAGDLAKVADSITNFGIGHHEEVAAGIKSFARDVRDIVAAAGAAAREVLAIGDALNKLAHLQPIDLSSLIDFEGISKHFDEFIATWQHRWQAFKEFLQPPAAAPAPGSPRSTEISPERVMPRGGALFDRDRLGGGGALFQRQNFVQPEGGAPSLVKASYQEGALSPARSEAMRAMSEAVEKGVYDGLTDFARGTPGGAGGGGGGGGAGAGMSAIRANFAPGGGGGFGGGGGGPGGAAQPAGEPTSDGGAGTGGGPSSSPMGTLAGKPQGVTSIGGAGAGASGGAMRLMRGLVSRGWSPEAAAMMAGNVKAESNFNTGTVGDHGTSFGLAQWHNERARARMAAAKSAGKDWKDWDFQVEHLNKEWRGKFGDKSVASHDFGALSQQGRKFEGYSTNTFGARVAGAHRYLQQFSAGGGEAGKAPHFNLGDIRKSVMGSGGGVKDGAGGALPADILAKAQEAALAGGGPAVKKFMAANGYPNHGEAWCGEFAASVVHAAGGQPPAHPQVASNWRNWGTATNSPQPGDVAVRRTARTGSTGSHVTFVEKVDPKTGTFVGLGGNQGRFESTFRTGQYDFRHGETAKAAAQAKELHGAALRDHFGHRSRKHADLLGHAREAGLVGQPMQHKVTGSAHLTVDVNAPHGTQARMKSLEGMFTDAKINRGYNMPRASENS